MLLKYKVLISAALVVFIIFDNKTLCHEFSDMEMNTCLPPNNVENGQYSVLDNDYVPGSPVKPNTHIKFECNDNYGLYPPIKYINCKHGTFNNEIPKCVSTCPAYESTNSNINVDCFINGVKTNCSNREEMIENTTAVLSCKPYYEQPNKIKFTYSVCTNGTWSIPFIKCLPVCGYQVAKVIPLIVNGFDTKIGDFPWHVAIYRQRESDSKPLYICGGSIISETTVLSAAHCFMYDKTKNPVSEYRVGAGKYFSAYDADDDILAQIRQVKRIEVPETFLGRENDYLSDIAIIFVEKQFTFSNLVRPVCVDWKNRQTVIANGTLGTVVGWGSTNETKNVASDTLNQLNVPYITSQDCLALLPKIFSKFMKIDNICAGSNNGSSICVGDAGNGLVFQNPLDNKYYIRGVTSLSGRDPKRGTLCDNFNLALYINVSFYIDNFLKPNLINNTIY